MGYYRSRRQLQKTDILNLGGVRFLLRFSLCYYALSLHSDFTLDEQQKILLYSIRSSVEFAVVGF